jgi:hypothetical protein
MSTQPAVEAAIAKAAHALLGVVVTLAARVLPWSNRSQHDAYLAGYVDGLRERAKRP